MAFAQILPVGRGLEGCLGEARGASGLDSVRDAAEEKTLWDARACYLDR